MDGDEFSTRKAKGLTRSIVKQLSFDDYVNCLFGDVNFEPAFKKQRLIRSEKHIIFTIEENKATLSALDDKRIVAPNGIDTFPFGFKK